jgi:hypothetical protein
MWESKSWEAGLGGQLKMENENAESLGIME